MIKMLLDSLQLVRISFGLFVRHIKSLNMTEAGLDLEVTGHLWSLLASSKLGHALYGSSMSSVHGQWTQT